MAKPMISVFMPARNEEETIEKNIKTIKNGINSGKINHAVVVIEGSEDRTPEIAFKTLGLTEAQVEKLTKNRLKRGTLVLKNGFMLIYHEEAMGKGRAFMEAVLNLHNRTDHFKNRDSVLVNVDADAVDLNPKKLTALAEELRKEKHPMLLGTVTETPHDRPLLKRATGFRAMRSDALEPMFNAKHRLHQIWVKVLPAGLALDSALNWLIYPASEHMDSSIPDSIVPQSKIRLNHREAYRHERDTSQREERMLAKYRFGLAVRYPDRWNKTSGKAFGNLAFKEKYEEFRRRILKR